MSSFLERIEKLSPKHLALLAVELQNRLEASEKSKREPIAIIGIGCRIPGAEPGPQGFWQLLKEGRDAISQAPPDRWDAAAYYSADPDAPGRTSTLWGSFLPAVDHFDASHFGISRREAVSMDPQQRILMEVCWEALEHAGYSPRRLSGSATGVYVGISTLDYHGMLLERGEESLDAYFATGTSASIAAGRISYSLGLQGPSMAIDTACSSSLVSVHLACQALRAGECGMALAGGVNLILWPEVTIALSKAHMLTPDGRCKVFDSQADGFVRGEGCGVVILKRLSDALAGRDNVLAVIRGSAVNQDGRSSGITAPNGAAQEMVIRQALANAGVSPDEIGYVETHGTGTALGDPIEAHALAAVFGSVRAADNPLTVGSVKTNIGHLEAGAGIAGLIKVVLALEAGQIPPHLHFHQMNPHIDWGGMPVRIPVEPKPWQRGSKRRIAGVSSFGFSGTNAHAIVEEAPLFDRPKPELERPMHILALTARSQMALTQLVGKYAQALEHTESDLVDVCFTANAGRAQFDHRSVFCGATNAEMRQALLGRPVAEGVRSGTPEIAFLFSGQGAQYAGMGKELHASQPVFRHAIEQCATLLKGELELPLLEVLWGSATQQLNLTAYTQPALFALEYALAELWKSWGITPSAVLGHSVGEYVAACVAGVYSLEDGLKLMAARARLMQAVKGQGAMAAVWAPEERVLEALRGLEERVSIAAQNAPENLVISGFTAELTVAEERLQAAGARVERLAVSHGFHSPQMREMEAAFAAVTGGFHYAAPRVRLISSMTGEELSGEKMTDARYWVCQVQQPVRFQRSMETLRKLGYRTFVEIGPGNSLAGLGRQCIPEESLWAVSLKKGRAEWQQILESLGRVYVHGADVDWAGFDQPFQRRRVPLPTYPFERQRYWMDTGGGSRTPHSRQHAQAKLTATPVAAEAPADWFYRPVWQPKPLPTSSLRTAGNTARWLLIPDARGFAIALLDRLKEIGAETFLADPKQSIEAQLRKVDYDHVVHLTALDGPDSDEATLQTLAASQAIVMSGALSATQAILNTGSRARLWFLTRGSQPASGRRAFNVTQAPVWGLAKTIGLEHPEIWGGVIDLDPCETAQECAARVAGAILDNDGEDQVAFVQGQRQVARLVRLEAPVAPAITFRPDGLYLITGGLGGLGPRLASWMVERGARHLVLAGRTSLPDRSQWDRIPAGSPAGLKIAAVRHLEQLGAEVIVASTDICDPTQAAALFASFDPNELRGVMHLAASLDTAVVKDMTTEALAKVLAPKTIGTWLLHDLTSRLSLDFFVMFSSWASVLGARELGHYAAANQFMDTLAHHRRGLGLPALSVNWATWDEIRAAYEQVRLESAASGLTPMPAELALDALSKAMASGESQVAIAAVNWKVLKDIYQTRRHRPMLELVSGSTAESPVTTSPALTLVDRLTRATPGEWTEIVMAAVRLEAVAVLHLEPEELATDQGLFEIGMDSIMAVELKSRLEKLIGHALSPALIFSRPTVRALAEHLAEELRSLMPSQHPPDGQEWHASESELAAMLAEAIQEID